MFGSSELVPWTNLPVIEKNIEIDVDMLRAAPYKAASAADAANAKAAKAVTEDRRNSATPVALLLNIVDLGRDARAAALHEPKPSASRIVKLKQAM